MTAPEAPRTGKPERINLPPYIREAHEKARQVFAEGEASIREIDFVEAGVYPASMVKKDLEAVLGMQKTWAATTNSPRERVAYTIAEVLEGIILEQGELAEWFGDARTTRTAMYDDYVNKTDLIAEWFSPEEGSRVLALGIDVTFGETTIVGKLEDIRTEIDSGRLGRLKYFKDSRGDFMGVRRNVPRVVIGISHEVVSQLSKLWVAGDKKALGRHAVQRVFLEQMHAQLKAMHDYAMATNQYDVGDAYIGPLSTVTKLLVEKRKLDLGPLNKDPVFLEILDQTKRIFK